MQRQRLFVVAMLLLLGMAFDSCMRDDREVLPEKQQNASSRSEVRDFQEHFLEIYDEDKLRATFSSSKFTPLEFKGLRPFWDKAYVNKLGSDLEIVEVPLSADELHVAIPQILSIEELEKYQRKSYSISLIRERSLKTQKVKEFFLCYVPSSETLEKGLPDYYHLLSLPKDFSGELILFDLQLKPFYRYSVVDGYTEERYFHSKQTKEQLRSWIWKGECNLLMHENGWFVEAIVTPQKTVIATNPDYDPNKHYFTIECDGYYDWVSEHYDYSVSADGIITRMPRDKPRWPYAPGDITDLNNPTGGYGEGGGGSSAVDKVMPPAPVKDLAFLIKPANFNKFNEKAINTLGVEYSKMLEQHWIHKKVDEIIRSYPNLRQLNGISIEPSKVTREGAIPSAGINKAYVFNFYEAKNITASVLFHEWIHIAQFHEHKMFNKSGGIDPDMFAARRGIMEFEGWLLRDINKYVLGEGYSNKNNPYDREPWGIPSRASSVKDGRHIDLEYDKWLSELTNGGTEYPKAPINATKFRHFAEEFIKRGVYSYHKFSLSPNLKYQPSLLNKIFQQQ